MLDVGYWINKEKIAMRFIKMIVFVVLLMALVPVLFGADAYNETVKVRVTPSKVIYFGTVTCSGSTDNSFYTQAMRIADCNLGNAYIGAVCSALTGTEDVNVKIEYSLDRTNWLDSSVNNGVIIDNVTTNMKIDTLNVYRGVYCTYYPAALWMRVEIDEQPSNPACVVSWYVILPKSENYKFDADEEREAIRMKDKY
jgi:hypothetical protein